MTPDDYGRLAVECVAMALLACGVYAFIFVSFAL
jgi:hypothetical protein